MSTTQQDPHYLAATLSKAAESMYRHPTYDRSFDSGRYPSNTSQPSLSHSLNTYTESYPPSLCRRDCGDYSADMTHSDCETGCTDVAPSLDDTSDVDEALSSVSHSKPSLLKFVEPVVQREHTNGQPRLTGMKKKMQRSKKADDGAFGVHHLPVLGFTDSRATYDSDELLHMDQFPGVPTRDINSSTGKEQWNVDTIEIGLEDLMLIKGKAKSMFLEAADDGAEETKSASRLMPTRRAAAHSVFDETAEQDRPHLPSARARTQSGAKRTAPLEPLPPLPPPKPTVSTGDTPSSQTTGLQPSSSHPLVLPSGESSDEDVFAFKLPTLLPHDSHQGTIRAPRASRLNSITSSSSHSSSTRDLDPREIIQRARLENTSCGLDAELDSSSNLNPIFPIPERRGSSGSGVVAEDLPPLMSNHYLQGHVDPVEYARLNRMPERLAAATVTSSGQKLSSKHLNKHRKKEGEQVGYEPISILRAEAAFLKEDGGKEKKKNKERPWKGSNGASNSSSDVSSEGNKLKSFKSSLFLRGQK
ncbi:hypothetical protein PSEUBRA_005183 [Kalmanozyma brasiliensis GHG001]|uniref:Uncharacterized protein n=1 Tax=Kalmanozyma brasiliensis (strain GHG001) TaxID=1365824 RepID=V5E5K6_KALBG|nr:uncharacterized protein PSEUBRA_005183 [Kalmanozyma brasiliensis GHG001]EST05501.1 hypothetical protein PSEUBRA_005183 [Kalmanozyma brasiliensis GHG001]